MTFSIAKKKNLRQDLPSVFAHPRFSLRLSIFFPSKEREAGTRVFFLVIHMDGCSSRRNVIDDIPLKAFSEERLEDEHSMPKTINSY